MESDDPKVMKLLAKKIEEAARDSAIKVVEESEDDHNRFRTWDQLGFFDRVTHFRNHEKIFRYTVVKDTIEHKNNIVMFDLARTYSEEFIDIAKEQINDLAVTLQCTLTILHNGFFNILVEDKDVQRFRVRDIPGVISETVFKEAGIGGIRDIKVKSTESSINITYEHESKQIEGYRLKDIVQHHSYYEITVDLDHFSFEYKVDSIDKFKLCPDSFVFETKADTRIIEILIGFASDAQNQNKTEIYQRLLKSTKESYEFKNYIETIPNGPTSVGATFEFINDPNSNFDLKLMGI